MVLRRRSRVRAFIALTTVLQALAVVFGVSGLLQPAPAAAVQSVPYLINFQGRLSDNSGNVLSNGSYNIKFRLFDALSAGTNRWEGDRVYGASDNRITVTNGLFNIQFGDTTKGDPALSPGLFNTQTYAGLYLEVELPTPATATCATNGCAVFTEGAMTPRQPLASTPYAINSDTLDGLDSSAFVQLSPSSQQAGAINVSGNIQTAAALQGATATLSGASSLTVGTSSTATGSVIFKNSVNANAVTLSVGTTSANYSLTLPTALGAANSCLIDSTGGGALSFASCSSGSGSVVLVPGTTASNTIAPTAASVVALTVKGTTGTSANVMEVFDSTATPARQAFFDATGSLNVAKAIQPTVANATDIGLSATQFRSGYFGTSVLSPLLDTASATALNIGSSVATSINIGKTATSNIATSITGTTVIKPVTDSITALQVQRSSAEVVLKVDTTNNRVKVGDDTASSTTPIALVGQAVNNATAVTTLTVTKTSTAGNLLVMTIGTNSSSGTYPTGVTDTAGNTWVKAGTAFGASLTGSRTDIWYAANAAAITSATITNNASTDTTANLSEYSGVALTSPLDTAVTNVNSSTTTNTTGTATTTTGGDLLVADMSYNTSTTTTGPGGSWVNLTDSNDTTKYLRSAYQISGTAGPYSATWTTGSAITSGAVLAAFKPAVAPTASTTTLLVLDTSATAQAPGGVNGGMYYDTTLNKFRCFENGSYANCIGGSPTTLQNAYDNSSSPAQILLSDAKNLNFVAPDTPTDPSIVMNFQCTTACSAGGGAFSVQHNGTAVFSVNQNTNASSAFLFHPTVDSNVAFQVQDSASNALLTADTTNTLVKIGTTATATLANVRLLVTLAEVSSTLRVGDATNGFEVSSSSGPLYRGTARPTRRITMSPEYAGAVLRPSGTNNTGTMTTSYDATSGHNYYAWTTTQGTSQTYDVAVRVPIPLDFSALTTTPQICFYGYTTSTVNSTLVLNMSDTANAAVTLGSSSFTPASASAWTETCQTISGTPTLSPGGYMTLRMTLSALSSSSVRLGEFRLDYLAKF